MLDLDRCPHCQVDIPSLTAVTEFETVVVEYTLEFVEALSPERAQLRIRELSSETEELHLGLVPAAEKIINVELHTDLAKVTLNPHLRGFKVMEIGRHLGEMRVRFTNEVQITESEVHHFSGTRLDNNPTCEVAAAHIDHPIRDFFGRAAEETFLTRATLWRIFQGVSTEQKSTLRAHPEGWANNFVRVVGDTVKDHIVDRLRFRDTGTRDDDIGPIEEAFPIDPSLVQRELIDGGRRKLVLAERYFATLGIDYRFVSPNVDKYWQPRATLAKQKKMRVTEPTGVAVMVYDLKAAATAFSEAHAPEKLGHVYLGARKARRPGLFVAKVVGNSMSRVAPDGSWCLWQHIGTGGVPAPSPGEYLLVRREDPDDPHLGGFTFKRWELTPAGTRLVPVSRDAGFRPILLAPEDEETTTHLARFIEVLHLQLDDIESRVTVALKYWTKSNVSRDAV